MNIFKKALLVVVLGMSVNAFPEELETVFSEAEVEQPVAEEPKAEEATPAPVDEQSGNEDQDLEAFLKSLEDDESAPQE